ncbi:MAG: chemotaxis protein CheW [Gammaproteobacteria bacterium]|nr:chemotaxis protein CheW [Gammaproteobacteria bacterium]
MAMNSEKNNITKLVDQQHAMDAYLDGLLAEVTEAPVPVAEEEPAVVVDLRPAEVVPDVVVDTEPETEAVVEVEVQAEEEGLPDWAEAQFQCLIFTVHGLKLAVPLARLNGILTWSDEISPMPGHAPHFRGLLQAHDVNVRVVDPAMLVMPEDRTPPEIGEEGRETPKNIILIDNKKWGLAADNVSETVTLNPDEVRWRTARGTRKWLAGTVIEHMCALLDADEFARILERREPGA